MTIIASSASGHLLGVKDSKGPSLTSQQYTQNLLRQLIARQRDLGAQTGLPNYDAPALEQSLPLPEEHDEFQTPSSAFMVSGRPKRIIEKEQTPVSQAHARVRERERTKQILSDFQEANGPYPQMTPQSSPLPPGRASRGTSP